MIKNNVCRKTIFTPTVLGIVDEGAQTQIVLSIEEVEIMRLLDLEGLTKEEVAKRLNISKNELQTIINAARKKMTDVLVNNYSLEVSCDHYEPSECTYKCTHCGHEYIAELKEDKHFCPKCNSSEIYCKEQNS